MLGKQLAPKPQQPVCALGVFPYSAFYDQVLFLLSLGLAGEVFAEFESRAKRKRFRSVLRFSPPLILRLRAARRCRVFGRCSLD